ncbi:MAG: TonB-dependent receptor [Bradyrhizobium sp.]|nr:TonB-dependent receptor [Bradyrhizobium sp.]
MNMFKRVDHELAPFSRRLSRGLLLGTVASLSMTHAAFAQTAPAATDTGDIIVTAQRVAEPLSKTPVTMSALGGDELARRHYTSVEDFKGSVPGLQVNNYVGNARANIRGIGQNTLSQGIDSQIAFSLDGVYVGQSFTAAQGFLDLERIEVLRGPQGTLYGRNATGGVINVITARPTDHLEGSAELTLGNYGAVRTEGMISGPLFGDSVLGRLVFSTDNHKGYSRNLFDNKFYDDASTQTVRGTLIFNLASNLSLTLVGDYHHEDDGNHATHLFGTSPGFPTITGVVLGGSTVPLDAHGQAINPRLLDINTIPNNVHNGGGILADLSWKISDEVSFKSLSSYRRTDVHFNLDFDSTNTAFPGLIPNNDMAYFQNSTQYSQEFQLTGNTGRLKWVTGLYYFNQKIDPGYFSLGINVGTPSAPFVVPLKLGGSTNTDAYAAFAQATWQATDQLALTGGLRYSDEKRTAAVSVLLPAFGVNYTSFGDATFHDISPKFTASYQASPHLLFYATVSKGFQSGGFDLTAQPAPTGPIAPFRPEKIWDYEGGVKYKNSWLTTDFAVFHYDYTDLQVSQIVNGLPQTTNAASSGVNGAEFSGTIKASPALTISGSFAYLDAKFKNFTENDTLSGLPVNLSGNQLPGSTKYSSNLSANYVVPIGGSSLALFGEWNWHSRLYFTEFNSNQVSQQGLSTYTASVRFTPAGGRWYVEVFGKNLSNRLIANQKWITGAGFGSMVIGSVAPPRTFGITLHYTLK